MSSAGALIAASFRLRFANTFVLPLYFLIVQDGPVLLLFGIAYLFVVRLARSNSGQPIERFLARMRSDRVTWAGAVGVGCAVVLIRRLAYDDCALSLDEFWAEFDAVTIASGRLLAPVAPEWRDFVPALQPTFRLPVPGNMYLLSSYLPGNAALRAVFQLLGDQGLEGAVLAGVALVALHGIARRVWPDRPDAAIVAVVLLACSAQFLITAATPYAMTAHLALNLVWLWLFLRDTRTSHGLAGGLAFIGCGLHQVVFHPLFAAPFVLALVLRRRWSAAAFYTVVYAASGLFWVLYWNLLFEVVGAPVEGAGVTGFVDRVGGLVTMSVGGVTLMVLNLLRFLAWQSPVVLPLALLGIRSRKGRNSTILCLELGMIATVGMALVVLPSQGHGWGYRYLHGALGSLSLIAAEGWIHATKSASRITGFPGLVLLSSVVTSALLLLPWRAYQVHNFVHPYASASAVIASAQAEVLIVDDFDIWFGTDLVRNDPFLRNVPKVLSLSRLDVEKLRELCANHDVVVFDDGDARKFGVRTVPEGSERNMANRKAMREVLSSPGCARPFD